MGLEFAIDELYATGWTGGDPSQCERHADGRDYPTPDAVREAFERTGCHLELKHIQLFDCYRAEWTDPDGRAAGAVVGQTADEAVVYALSHLRRSSAWKSAASAGA